ncbi:hydantoinase/carbamoylase family amidase [Kocuria indica]|uniref:Hydantoinase/carbamoylase family amidase n=1 Tax=Kocuria marina subsp. indica TaxID=1049583 RepID=A0A6N9QXT2_9MICC|nr:M20 family metallo-hydrolase [Kocuria indica]NDO78052.1 hydantoinase/carbamoylase family amidase [Kocuria indica]
MSVLHQAFLRDFRQMSRNGGLESGGVERQAATTADGLNRQWFAGWLTARGATVHYDAIGNQFGLFELRPGAPYVMVGSHLDSQPRAGRFDGAYGVLAGASVCAELYRAASSGETELTYNLCVVNWFNEEGCRFKPSMMGSLVHTGKLELDAALAITDVSGVSVWDALDALGQRGTDELPEAAAYVEIHIEQGKSMEENGHMIGLVHATWGARKYEFQVLGEQSHTGATLIKDRKDALLGASLLIAAARRVALEFGVVTSCGELLIEPNSPVAVAREARLLIDLRSPDAETLDAADAAFGESVTRAASDANVEIRTLNRHAWDVKEYAPEGVALAERVVRELGLPYTRIMTLAGHDSTNVKDVLPTIMLFIPSHKGITHNEYEFTSDQDMLAGLDMLTATLTRVAQGELDG